MIPVIHREEDIFKDYVWNSHQIWAQKDTQLPNRVPNIFPIHGFRDAVLVHKITVVTR